MSKEKTSIDHAATGIQFEELRASWFDQLGSKQKAAEARKAAAMWKGRYQAALDFRAKEEGN